MLRERAIQIGMQGGLSDFYVNNTLSIEDVTELAHEVGRAHRQKKEKDCEKAVRDIDGLPIEREYEPAMSQAHMLRLGMLSGEAAVRIAQLGRGGLKNT